MLREESDGVSQWGLVMLEWLYSCFDGVQSQVNRLSFFVINSKLKPMYVRLELLDHHLWCNVPLLEQKEAARFGNGNGVCDLSLSGGCVVCSVCRWRLTLVDGLLLAFLDDKVDGDDGDGVS